MNTPPATCTRLQAAGWSALNATDWTHPEHVGPHCYLVALLLSDLPRVKYDMEAVPANMGSVKYDKMNQAQQLDNLISGGRTVAEAAKELGMTSRHAHETLARAKARAKKKAMQ